MCKAKLYGNGKPNSRIDKCMDVVINVLQLHNIKTVACCCGHGKYHMSIVCASLGSHYELFSGKHIPRKRKFYKRDKQGYYYIPEVANFIGPYTPYPNLKKQYKEIKIDTGNGGLYL